MDFGWGEDPTHLAPTTPAPSILPAPPSWDRGRGTGDSIQGRPASSSGSIEGTTGVWLNIEGTMGVCGEHRLDKGGGWN